MPDNAVSMLLKTFEFYIDRAFMKGEKEEGAERWGLGVRGGDRFVILSREGW